MGRHIIVALESVAKIWLSFGNDVVENVSKVGLHIGVGIFVDAKSRRSVLDEYIEYYNEVRMYRTLKMKTPSQVETEFFERVVL